MALKSPYTVCCPRCKECFSAEEYRRHICYLDNLKQMEMGDFVVNKK